MNLDKFGILGAVIICNGPPTDLPTTNNSLSLSLTKGMHHHQTTLADRTIVDTRVSARNQNKKVSKHQRIELSQHPVEDEEALGMDDDNDSSLLSSQLGIMLLPEDPGSGKETEEEDEVRSFAATAGNPHLSQCQHDLPHNLASGDNGPPGLGTIISDPLDKALDRLPSLLEHESALLKLDKILWKPHTCTTFDLVISWLEEALPDNTFKDQSKLPRCKMLMKCLDAKFKTRPHELVTVSLETGIEDSGIDGYH